MFIKNSHTPGLFSLNNRHGRSIFSARSQRRLKIFINTALYRDFYMNKFGVTFIELMATLAIISILATGIMPLSRVIYKRTKEIELRNNLRVIRSAIDAYKKMTDDGLIPVSADSTGYPGTLDVLVNGVDLKEPKKVKQKFLRRVPKDPMSEDGEWGLRSYADTPDSSIWGGQDVYDVYSMSDKQALDGSYYREW